MKKTWLPCIWILLAALLATVAPAPSSMAAEEPPIEYVSFRLGVYSPQHNEMSDYKEGINGELYYGYYFRKHIIFELGIGYFNTESNANPPGSISLDVLDIQYNVKATVHLGPVELYGGPGIALYYAKATYETFGEESDWEGGYGYGLVAGANLDLSKEWFAGIEGKYLWAKIDDPLLPTSGNLSAHIDGLTGTLVLGYRF